MARAITYMIEGPGVMSSTEVALRKIDQCARSGTSLGSSLCVLFLRSGRNAVPNFLLEMACRMFRQIPFELAIDDLDVYCPRHEAALSQAETAPARVREF